MDWREFIVFSRLDQQYSDISTILAHRSEVMISHDLVLSGPQFRNCIGYNIRSTVNDSCWNCEVIQLVKYV